MRAVWCITDATTLCVAVSLSGAALADPIDPPMVKKAAKTKPGKAKPDKNQYWLLNPVPPDQMRSSILTGRPKRTCRTPSTPGTFNTRPI